jgi:hypothetical protein
MKIKLVKSYIDNYKSNFQEVHLQEIYKWRAFKCFQDNWDINSPDFTSMLSQSLELSNNLLDSGNYFPKRMLLGNTKLSEGQVRDLFFLLVDEDEDLPKRILDFRKEIKKINNVNYPGKNDYQDHRAIITYLCLIYPEKYYLYKYSMFCDFIEKINHSYKPVMGRIENIGQYFNMCGILRDELSQDQELLKLHKERIDKDCYYDKNYNLLTQDFIYAVTRHLDIKDSLVSKEIVFPIALYINENSIIKTERKKNFRPKLIDRIGKQNQNKIIGDLGEHWVVKYEKKKLNDLGLNHLIKKVKHTSVEKGDGAGYDIKSFDNSENEIFIEVKTTRGKCSTPFYITNTELMFSIKENGNYRLYRLYNYDSKNENFEIGIFKGDLTELCYAPETYIVRVSTPTQRDRI